MKSNPTAIATQLSKAQMVELIKANWSNVHVKAKNVELKHISTNMTHYYVKPA